MSAVEKQARSNTSLAAAGASCSDTYLHCAADGRVLQTHIGVIRSKSSEPSLGSCGAPRYYEVCATVRGPSFSAFVRDSPPAGVSVSECSHDGRRSLGLAYYVLVSERRRCFEPTPLLSSLRAACFLRPRYVSQTQFSSAKRTFSLPSVCLSCFRAFSFADAFRCCIVPLGVSFCCAAEIVRNLLPARATERPVFVSHLMGRNRLTGFIGWLL